MQNMKVEKMFLSCKEVSTLFDVHPETIRRWVRKSYNGFPVPIKVGGLRGSPVRFITTDIQSYISRNPREDQE